MDYQYIKLNISSKEKKRRLIGFFQYDNDSWWALSYAEQIQYLLFGGADSCTIMKMPRRGGINFLNTLRLLLVK